MSHSTNHEHHACFEIKALVVMGVVLLLLVEVRLVVVAVLLLYRLVAHQVWLVVEQQCPSALSQQVVQLCQTPGLALAGTVDL